MGHFSMHKTQASISNSPTEYIFLAPIPNRETAGQNALHHSSVEGGKDGSGVVDSLQPPFEMEALLGLLG